MIRTFRILPLVLLIGAVGLAACGGQNGATPEAEIPIVVDAISVIAEGRLVPDQSVQLSFLVGGQVSEILVEEGETVQAGQVIARLENREQAQALVAAASMELISAQQALRTLRDEAALRRAQAELSLANAVDKLEDEQYDWRVKQEGNRANGEVIAAEEANLVLAEREVDAAEKAYNRYSGRKDSDPSKALARSNLSAARQHRDSILRRLNWYRGAPTDNDQAMLDADVAIAEAEVTLAQLEVERWRNGPDPEQLALAEARVDNAEAQLAAARSSLADTELRAPIRGQVADLRLKVGEQVAPGQVVAVLADFATWIVETENLTEIELPKIALGQPVNVTFDALPEIDLAGRVTEISPLFREVGGDITYDVKIMLEEIDPRLQWGMTSVVTFEDGE